MKKITRLMGCLVLTVLSTHAWGFVTVGTDASCDYDNLEDAYNDADNFVRVTTQEAFTDRFTIAKPQWFTGGYANCTDANNNIRSGSRSEWESLAGRVVTIDAQLAARSIVVIDGFEIFFGIDINPGGTGGILLTGNSQLLLADSLVRANISILGGGIKVSGPQAAALISNSHITGNSASEGGGVYCDDQGTVQILGNSSVALNEATRGGGVYGGDDCQIEMNSGDTLAPELVQYGILRNTAERGGGVFLTDGAEMEINGTLAHPASIIKNVADGDNFENGGGVALTGVGTRFEAVNGRIDANIGSYYGGGFAVRDQAVFVMRRLAGDCWDNSRCSSLSDNVLVGQPNVPIGLGAAGDIYRGGTAVISQTRIDGNQGNNVSGFNLSEFAYLRSEGNLMVNNRHYDNNTQTVFTRVDGTPGNGSNVDVFYNTFANNTTTGPLFHLRNDTQHVVNVFNSILDHGTDTLGFFGGGVNNSIMQWDCLFLNETGSLAGNLGFLSVADPLFVNAVQSNYQLSLASPAIDVCDESAFIGATYPDFIDQQRGLDNPNVQNVLGSFDAGAYEFNHDLIFKNGF